MKHQRRLWTFRWNKCRCGLSWPCPDSLWPEGQPIPDGQLRHRPAPWNTPTIAVPILAEPQIGRAGRLTPAQDHRANSGRCR